MLQSFVPYNFIKWRSIYYMLLSTNESMLMEFNRVQIIFKKALMETMELLLVSRMERTLHIHTLSYQRASLQYPLAQNILIHYEVALVLPALPFHLQKIK